MQKRELFVITLTIAFGIASGILSGLYAKTGCRTIDIGNGADEGYPK